jgi:hypothetical protein
VIKDATGEFVEVKLSTSFQNARRRSSGTLPDDFDLRRRGSMTLNNVTFVDDPFRVTGYHGGKYHVDYRLQSMEPTEDLENDVFRALKEDILFFSMPPVQSIPSNPSRSLEIPKFLPGERKVTCVIAYIEASEIVKLTVRIDDEEQEREVLGTTDDRQWRRVQNWAINGTVGIDELVQEVLS